MQAYHVPGMEAIRVIPAAASSLSPPPLFLSLSSPPSHIFFKFSKKSPPEPSLDLEKYLVAYEDRDPGVWDGLFMNAVALDRHNRRASSTAKTPRKDTERRIAVDYYLSLTNKRRKEGVYVCEHLLDGNCCDLWLR